jgi:hypothetical protein
VNNQLFIGKLHIRKTFIMKPMKVTADQLMCKTCGTVIPKGQTKCPNPRCATNLPLTGKKKTKVVTA